jgi:23S rRNA (guanosine2251-2'-O)-methyltransferase
VVCLDGAQDPRNLGAVARVAEAAGAAGIVITRRGSPGVTPAACKASAGAVEHLALARVENLSAFLHDARGADRWAVGADAEAGDDYRAVDLDAGTILVLGAEGTGLRPRVRASCDRLVRIPMAGRTASLNLAVAAGVLLFEIRRRIDP